MLQNRQVWSLDDYVVNKRVYKGSASAVYKATCRYSGLTVALKDDSERVVLVQEFAPQGDLYGVLQKLGGRMQQDQPENLLFSGSWRIMVSDFGVSIDLNQERAVTRAGTEGYMAPEVERCPLKSDPKENKDQPHLAYSTSVDIWAVGVLAYELLTGFPPVVMPAAAPKRPGLGGAGEGDSGSSVSGFVRSHMTAATLHFPASVPPAARSFIAAALSPDPLDRPTAAQLLQHPWITAAAAATARRAAARAADAALTAQAQAGAAGAAAAEALPSSGGGDGGYVRGRSEPGNDAGGSHQARGAQQVSVRQVNGQRSSSRFASVSEVVVPPPPM
ncbi:hypothetical protein GPECTOR_5g230 [Gonium pectorale]|uniref:Protein kinase domain-containing protein n=1 Tax=Gonium pectorale TaxID=33097 RepID=A0A150GXN4_GONPE|nr:hypothetical protein GPECTOR_5g230 [Gonium pectorale]|eukprot:KXZ54130.1 hypothetical protein GPECTOR_5g230 [Gonium pectorale]